MEIGRREFILRTTAGAALRAMTAEDAAVWTAITDRLSRATGRG